MRWREGRGRTALTLEVKKIGCDHGLWLYGGQKHIGAVALAYRVRKKMRSRILTVPGHRESGLALALAVKAVKVWKTSCLAVVGIHLEKITAGEIQMVLKNAAKLITKIH